MKEVVQEADEVSLQAMPAGGRGGKSCEPIVYGCGPRSKEP